MKFAIFLVLLSVAMLGQIKLTAAHLLTEIDVMAFANGAGFTREDGAMSSRTI